MRPRLFLVILTCMFTAAFSQSTVTVSINGAKKGVYTIQADQNEAGITLKKADCKKMKQLLIQIKGDQTSNKVYKRTLDIADKAEQTILNLPETATGEFTVTDIKIKNLLLKGIPVKLYLRMEPVDDRLLIPMKHIYLGTLSAK